MLGYFKTSNTLHSIYFGRAKHQYSITHKTDWVAHLNSIKSPALVLVPHTVGLLPTCVTLSSPGLVIDEGDAGDLLSSAACCFFRLAASAFLSACKKHQAAKLLLLYKVE